MSSRVRAGVGVARRVHEEALALRARVWAIGQEVRANPEEALREGTGAATGDPMPQLIAGQLGWVHSTVMPVIGCEMVSGRDPDEVSREVLVLLGGVEELLREKTLNCAVRGA